MKIESLPVIMHFDYEKNKVKIEIVEDFEWKEWRFKAGWMSDGHSVGGLFKHFDAWTLAALAHDQDCELANRKQSYDIRKRGDKNYRINLKELGAPRSTVYRRYAAVSARTKWLMLTGRIS